MKISEYEEGEKLIKWFNEISSIYGGDLEEFLNVLSRGPFTYMECKKYGVMYDRYYFMYKRDKVLDAMKYIKKKKLFTEFCLNNFNIIIKKLKKDE